ncbi:hypothetical protein [Streptomyces sp. NPDC058412]|uniref:hypothetical protein n=1 Tax=Streptomyces sp. NPDC058412 TaxID=3346486 RepID=UPI00366719B9
MERLIDPRAFREVLGAFASGITVVAAVGEDGRPAGLASASYHTTAHDPPQVLLCGGR